MGMHLFVYINPRKKGECFSLPSETRKIKEALDKFEQKKTAHFTSNFQVWDDAADDVAREFSKDYPDYYFYIKTEIDTYIEYHVGINGEHYDSNIAEFTQCLSRGRIQLFSGEREVLNQPTLQEILNHPDIHHLNLGKDSVAFQKFCIQELFRNDKDYLAANLLYVGIRSDPKHSKQDILIQGTKNTVKNTLKIRCFSDQEIQEILAGFEYAIAQEKYQELLGEVKGKAKKIDALYQQVLAFVKNAQQQGHAILCVPTSTTLDLDALKTL